MHGVSTQEEVARNFSLQLLNQREAVSENVRQLLMGSLSSDISNIEISESSFLLLFLVSEAMQPLITFLQTISWLQALFLLLHLFTVIIRHSNLPPLFRIAFYSLSPNQIKIHLFLITIQTHCSSPYSQYSS